MLSDCLEADHRRLESLLEQACAKQEAIEPHAYAEFRSGLLRHIMIEERYLLPLMPGLLGPEPQPKLAQIKLDHGAIAALLVPPPTAGIVRALKAILEGHNVLEEGGGGFYELCERLPQADLQPLVERVRKAGEVRAQPHNPAPAVLDATRRALARAGYDLDRFLSPPDAG